MTTVENQTQTQNQSPETDNIDIIQEEEKRPEDEVAIPGVLNDFSVKHPLQNSWTWWFDNPKKKSTQSSWGDNLKQIYTFGTIEDFWSLWNNIKGAHELAHGSDYHVFKEGIQPKWEDKANQDGGKWVVQLPKSGPQKKERLNQVWLLSILGCIGASFENDDQICGLVVSVRKNGDKVALWTSKSSDEHAVKRIGEQLKEMLSVSNTIGYQAHKEAIGNNSSYENRHLYEA